MYEAFSNLSFADDQPELYMNRVLVRTLTCSRLGESRQSDFHQYFKEGWYLPDSTIDNGYALMTVTIWP
ncbi:MAG: hypothetical protein ACLU93_03075 [Streptococcus sp.]